MKQRAGTLLMLLLVLLFAVAARAGEVVTETQEHMGTIVSVSVYADDPARAREAIAAVFAEIARLDRVFSNYRPDSAISEINARAGKEPVSVSPEVFDVLRASLDAGERSDGAFDITFHGLNAWDFKDGQGSLPPPERIAERLRFVNFRNVILDPEKRTVRFALPGMSIGLGGIVKGYAADRGAAILRAAGFSDFIVNPGGNLYVSGSKGGRPWTVGVQHPRRPHGELIAVLSGPSGAVVTSGDYEKFFIRDGKRYHHIIDPRTGYPAEGTMSATVIARDGLTADWLATAVIVLGPGCGVRLVESIPGAHCLIYATDGRRVTSVGFEKAVAVRYREE